MIGESSSCDSCGHVTDEALDLCPKCGRRLRAASHVRRLGWLQLAIGLFIVGLMGTITFNLAPMMLRTGETQGGAQFTGTPEQALLIRGLFGLVIVLGLGSKDTGRQNSIWLPSV